MRTKKQIIKSCLIVSMVLSLFLFAICNLEPVRAATVKAKYTVLLGNKTNCLPVYQSTKNITYTYQSTNKKIATVNKKKGTIHAKKVGTVLIKLTKKQKGKKSTATYYQVTVVDMKIKGSSVISAGNKSVLKTNIKNIKVKWEVSDESIATISNTGVFTALSQGEVTVIASYKDAIAIKEVSITSSTEPIKITIKNREFKVGDVMIFTANKEKVVWKSSNSSVATIDSTSGLFKAVGAGTVSITATSEDKKEMDVITITIATDKNNSLSIYTGNTNLSLGEERYLVSNKTGTIWMSSNTDVLTINTDGKITARGYGIATVYAICGAETVTVQFTVVNNSNSLKITSSASVFQIGTSSYFTSNKAGTAWFSSNTNLATIDKDTGLFTARGIGTVTIYAVYGSETISVSVTITNTSGNVIINPTKTTFQVGTYTYLTTNQNHAVWASSNTNVATIDATTGLLYAKSVGTAVIYVNYENQVASIPITVIAADYTSEQLVAKNSAVNAINNIPNPVTEYNLDSVKTYLTIAKGKIDVAKRSGVSINDITNYSDYTRLLDSWLKTEKVGGTNIPYAVQKVTDIKAIETAISAMRAAVDTSSMSQRLAKVNEIESSIIRAESTYLMERTEITNYTVYQTERAALGLK